MSHKVSQQRPHEDKTSKSSDTLLNIFKSTPFQQKQYIHKGHSLGRLKLRTDWRHVLHNCALFCESANQSHMLFRLDVGEGISSCLAWSGPAESGLPPQLCVNDD